jgi:hypothetical protein
MSDFHGPEESRALQRQMALEKRDINLDDLSTDEMHAVKEKMAALDRFFGGQKIAAKFKIEVQFGKARSTWKPFVGALSVFLSGLKFHGGGDGKLYFCPKDGCTGILYPHERVGGKLLCRACDQVWKSEEVTGELMFILPSQKWATVVHRMFVRLDHNADIYLKFHPTDIRYQTMMEMARRRGGEEIRKARENRGLHIYPLKNIIVDTKNGADLYKRFLAFINA